MKRHLICLQLRFEASQEVGNAIVTGGLKWQYIVMIATFSSCILIPPAAVFISFSIILYPISLNTKTTNPQTSTRLSILARLDVISLTRNDITVRLCQIVTSESMLLREVFFRQALSPFFV